MPIFEYICPSCGKEFEELVLGSSNQITCPACGSPEPRKKMSSFALKSGSTFVGTGKKAGSCGGCTSSNCGSCGG